MISGIMRRSTGQAISLISRIGCHIGLMQLVKIKITKKGWSRKIVDATLLNKF